MASFPLHSCQIPRSLLQLLPCKYPYPLPPHHCFCLATSRPCSIFHCRPCLNSAGDEHTTCSVTHRESQMGTQNSSNFPWCISLLHSNTFISHSFSPLRPPNLLHHMLHGENKSHQAGTPPSSYQQPHLPVSQLCAHAQNGQSLPSL